MLDYLFSWSAFYRRHTRGPWYKVCFGFPGALKHSHSWTRTACATRDKVLLVELGGVRVTKVFGY